MLRLGLVVVAVVLGVVGPVCASPIVNAAVGAARLCVDHPDCSTSGEALTLDPAGFIAAPMTGTLDVDPGSLQFEFDIVLQSVSPTNVDGTPTGLELHDVRFQGADQLQAPFPSSVGQWVSGTAQVDGTVVKIGEEAVVPFALDAAFYGSCLYTHCFIRFDAVNAVIPVDNELRFLTLTLHVGVPEPEMVLLLAVGLVLVGYARRR